MHLTPRLSLAVLCSTVVASCNAIAPTQPSRVIPRPVFDTTVREGPSVVVPLSVTLIVGPGSPVVGEPAAFTALTTPVMPDAAIYDWTFGDGSTTRTSATTTSHPYARTGTYAASVVVTEGTGRRAQTSTNVSVRSALGGFEPGPVPDQNAFKAVVGCTVKVVFGLVQCNVTTYENNRAEPSGSITRVDWDWGDGQQTQNGGPAQSHAYLQSGTFAVVTTVTASTESGVHTQRAFTNVSIQ